jgi:hypothetical protein
MSIAQLVRAIGDRDNQFHRSALSGNAMLFNGNMWVQLTAGADPLPAIGRSTPLTFIAAVVPQINGFDPQNNQFRSVIAMVTPNISSSNFPSIFNFVVSGDGFWHAVIDISASVANSFYSNAGTVNLLNRRVIVQSTYNGVLNNATSVRFFTNSLRRPTTLFSANASPMSPVAYPINIGRSNLYLSGRFIGYMRSVELIIGKVLTDEELRRAFNFGTAHAAGLITSADISIDFNRVNGQAPICRTGSRQLTVTPYNNTTPDTAGTTYADFYSL